MHKRQVIFEDIVEVLAPDTRPNRGYSTGERQWVVVTRKGSLLSVPTRRVPKGLRWGQTKTNDYFKAVYGD